MARPSAIDRLGRILAMVPWIASQNGPRIVDVCERFGISQQELVADLNVVFVVGLYPYTPENLIEVDFDDDRVWIDYTNFFERPLRLTRDEGLGLLTAGVALAAQPGHDPDGPLARGLAKIARVLGVDLADDLAVVVSSEETATHAALDAASQAGAVVHIDYFSHGRNEATERDIEPRHLFARDGIWYVEAFCRSSDGDRMFRLDRISAVHETGERFTPVAGDGERTLDLGVDAPRVVLDLPPEASWVVDQYPVDDAVTGPDGRIRATLAIAARPWLDRLLLRAGPGVVIVDGPEAWFDATAAAANSVLDRYAERA